MLRGTKGVKIKIDDEEDGDEMTRWMMVIRMVIRMTMMMMMMVITMMIMIMMMMIMINMLLLKVMVIANSDNSSYKY